MAYSTSTVIGRTDDGNLGVFNAANNTAGVIDGASNNNGGIFDLTNVVVGVCRINNGNTTSGVCNVTDSVV